MEGFALEKSRQHCWECDAPRPRRTRACLCAALGVADLKCRMEIVSLSSDTFQTRYPRKLASLGMSCLPYSPTKLCVTAIQSPKLIFL